MSPRSKGSAHGYRSSSCGVSPDYCCSHIERARWGYGSRLSRPSADVLVLRFGSRAMCLNVLGFLSVYLRSLAGFLRLPRCQFLPLRRPPVSVPSQTRPSQTASGITGVRGVYVDGSTVYAATYGGLSISSNACSSSSSSSSSSSGVDAGVPGIFLTVAGPVGRSASEAPV